MRSRQFVLIVMTLVAGTMPLAVGADPGARDSQAQAAAPPARPLLTAIDDAPAMSDPSGTSSFGEHVRAAGARLVRIGVQWRFVTPGGSAKPAGFDARNPGDPKYVWGSLDRTVRAAADNGLEPLLYVYTAPDWVQSGLKQRPNDGPIRPSVSELSDFLTALATRYSGSYASLPRVRYWQVWNEPNLSIYLMPQSEGGNVVSPDRYRAMVNAGASAIHAVRADNLVVAGGLAPFGGNVNEPSGVVVDQERIHPLQFMRQMLCMSSGATPRPTCSARSEFDAWAHHPYTYGAPTHSAAHPDDVSLGDLGAMRRLLDAASAAGHIETRQKVAFWVTEFSYDSKPADPNGLAPTLHARWVSESLYRMWSSGVSLVTWFRLRDDPFPQQYFQSGLYLRGPAGITSDRPKLALTAFRFPFVAFRQKRGAITYWGRTPTGTKKAVVVEQRQRGRWRRLVEPKVDRHGIFRGKVTRARGSGALRARLANGSDRSLAFSLTVPPDFRFCPWGSFC